MRHVPSVLCGWLLVTGTCVASTLLVPAGALPEPGGTAMEGVALGEPLRAVQSRLDFRGIIPAEDLDGRTVYRWPSSGGAPGAQSIQYLEIAFAKDMVVEIRSTYRSQQRYVRMGPVLTARYGDPTVLRSGPPLLQSSPPQRGASGSDPEEPVYRAPEAREEAPVYLWTEYWLWEWDGANFEVTGEHYTPDREQVADGLHVFRFRLTARPED